MGLSPLPSDEFFPLVNQAEEEFDAEVEAEDLWRFYATLYLDRPLADDFACLVDARRTEISDKNVLTGLSDYGII